MASTRDVIAPPVFAEDASTTIPPTPIAGVSYRDPVAGPASSADGWPYSEIVNSAEFNQLMFQWSTLLSIMDKKGILGWSDDVDYDESGIVLGSDGIVYIWLQESGPGTGAGIKDPVSEPTYWRDISTAQTFAQYGLGTTTPPQIGDMDAGDKLTGFYRYSNGVDTGTTPTGSAGNWLVLVQKFNATLTRQTAFEVNGTPGVTTNRYWVRNINGATVGPWEIQNGGDAVPVNVASASTVVLTTVALTTRNINITGATTINGFTVAAGQRYLVKFTGALTLVNSASLTTQRSANIVTAAGDTCIIRATAANTVEILCYTRAVSEVRTVAALSGTAVDFSSLPSHVNEFVLLASALSTSGTSPLTFQLGTGAGVEVTGYAGSVSGGNSGVGSNLMSTGFRADTARTASDTSHIRVTFTRVSGNLWVATGQFNNSDAGAFRQFSGSITLPGALTTIRITTDGGVNTFDSGTALLTYRE